MSVITVDEIGGKSADDDDAEIEYDLDDEDIAQQLSADSPGGGGDWRSLANNGRQHSQHKHAPISASGSRGALRRSVNSDSMGMTADIADFLADTDSESGEYGRPSNPREAMPRSMSMRQGGYGSQQAYQRTYSTRY